MTITDEMLYQAAPQAAELLLDTLPGRMACERDFSPEFEEKMGALLTRPRRRRPWKALLLAAAVIGALTVGLSVGADNPSDCQLYWSQSDGTTRYVVRLEHETKQAFRTVELAEIPQGFALAREGMNGEREYRVTYRDENDRYFTVTQRADDEYSGMILGDYQSSEVEIHNRLGMLAEAAESEECFLLWTDGPYILMIHGGGLPAEDLLGIAENIKW